MEQVVRESLALLLRIIEGIGSDISSEPTVSRYLRDVRRFLDHGTAISEADLIAVREVVELYISDNTCIPMGISENEASDDEAGDSADVEGERADMCTRTN